MHKDSAQKPPEMTNGDDRHPEADQRRSVHGHATADGLPSVATDPVCGMAVDPHATPHRATEGGRTFYFCSTGCRQKFEADPTRYLSPKQQEKAAQPPSEATVYTCPMHPEIRQGTPGSCPICGMALEPLLATAEEGPSTELVDMRRRFRIGLLLTAPVFLLEMGRHLTGLTHATGQQTSNWLQLVLATPVVLWAGWPFFVRGWRSLVTRQLNMFTLIALGTGAAWIYSMAGTLAPGLFPPALRGPDGAIPAYFEAAAVITVLVLLGQVLELRAREKTSGAIRALLDLTPKTARRLRADGTDEEVTLDRITEHARPFAEGKVGGDDDRGALIEPADQMEQQLPAGLSERQIAQFVENDEVEAGEIVGQASLTAGASLIFETVDQIDNGVEPPPGTALGCRPGRWQSQDGFCRFRCRRSARRCAVRRGSFPLPTRAPRLG